MSRRVFVLDTNVLMHDPTALFRFQEHDIFIPMVVLEELDAGKKGVSEVARNVRQVSRFLDELMAHKTHSEIDTKPSKIESRGLQNRAWSPPRRNFHKTSNLRRLWKAPILIFLALDGQLGSNSMCCTRTAALQGRKEKPQ